MENEMNVGSDRTARLKELNRHMANPGNKVIMGQHRVLRESDESNLRVEIQDVEVWSNEAKLGVARFTTYRDRTTGKAVISHIDPVEED